MSGVKNKVTEVVDKYCGKWLVFEEIEYSDKNGKLKKWEAVRRTTKGGAVVIVAKIKDRNELILVRQYRAPLNAYVIEFPAGLVDDGEDVSFSAERELLEETGYVGSVTTISSPNYSSPGMTNEFVYTVFMNVDLSNNQNPLQKCEETESIEVLRVNLIDMMPFINERITLGDRVDSKLYNFMLGFNFNF